jgi:hypothetical protein
MALTLAEAAEKYATDPRLGRLWYARFLQWETYKGSDLTDRQREELVQSWIAVEPDVRAQIESDAAYLAGYSGDAVVLSRPDKPWSLLASLNPFHDAATDGQVTLRNVRLFPATVDAASVPPAPSPRRRGGISELTRLAIEAVAGYVHASGLPPDPTERKLAQLAIDWATKSGLRTTELEADSGAMRAICRAFIDGISRADRQQ